MSRIRDSIRKVRKASKRPNKTQKDPTIDRKVIPLMERERIAQMHMLGKNKSKIAAETGHTRKSIAKIISETNIPAYVEKVRGRFVGLGELAVETLEKEMKSGNWELAYRFLKDSRILADTAARTFALNVATGNPTSQVSLTPEARDLMLNSLSVLPRLPSSLARRDSASGVRFQMESWGRAVQSVGAVLPIVQPAR